MLSAAGATIQRPSLHAANVRRLADVHLPRVAKIIDLVEKDQAAHLEAGDATLRYPTQSYGCRSDGVTGGPDSAVAVVTVAARTIIGRHETNVRSTQSDTGGSSAEEEKRLVWSGAAKSNVRFIIEYNS